MSDIKNYKKIQKTYKDRALQTVEYKGRIYQTTIKKDLTDEEFKQAVKEVLSIVKNYNHEITIIECDKDIKRAYKVKTIKDVKERCSSGGGTRFTPVFEYANNKNINLLIYFTDGKGEDKLGVI